MSVTRKAPRYSRDVLAPIITEHVNERARQASMPEPLHKVSFAPSIIADGVQHAVEDVMTL